MFLLSLSSCWALRRQAPWKGVSLRGAHRALLALAPIRWIAASRVYDNDHHPADVVCGAVLGGGFATLFYFRHFPSVFARDAHVAWGYGD